MSEGNDEGDELEKLTQQVKDFREQAKEDRKLIQKAADTLAEIGRNQGLSDIHADVLAALRIRIEGKPRKSLEDLLSAAGNIKGKRDLGEVLTGGDEKPTKDWPEVKPKSRDWPGL